jgi:hypothetical protein
VSLTASRTEPLVVHDPRGYPPKVEGKALAPRLDGLDGKRLFLIDCLFDNSDVFMAELRDWFTDRLPAVRIETIKPRESWVDDPEMRARVATEGGGPRGGPVKHL